MRKSEKEISNQDEIIQLLSSSFVGRLAMSNEGMPYVVPVNYGSRGRSIFFHSARGGKKIEWLRNNPRVCFEIDLPGEIITDNEACSWSIAYRSVIGFGEARFLEDEEEKREALDLIMSRAVELLERDGGGTGWPKSFTYSDSALKGVAVIRVDLETLTGKRSGV